jgi:hypothetical protein
VNYDHSVPDDQPDGLFRRWHALQTKRISDMFRSVFGDAAFGQRVRILYEYQYDDFQATASEGLTFLDRYFNNADGESHVTAPHPVNYFVWGAGAATYYGSGNPHGTQTKIAVPDADFERPQAASSWKFSGHAGLYRAPELHDAARMRDAGAASQASNPFLGLRFKVGARGVAVYELGRIAGSHDHGTHRVRILRAADRSVVAAAEFESKDTPAGRYAFGRLGHPVLLEPGQSYAVISEETPGDEVYAAPSLALDPALALEGSVSAHDPTSELPVVASGGLGPATFRFAVDPIGDLGFPPPPNGKQAAFIMGTGEVATSVDFGSGGNYALRLLVAGHGEATAPIDLLFDDQRITPYANGRDPRVNPEPFVGGRWAYDGSDLLEYVSVAVRAAGPHRIRVVGRGKPDQAVFFDDAAIVDVGAVFTGGIPGAGEAFGQVAIDDFAKQMAHQVRYAQAFGLHPVAYEGGWSIGGDFTSTTAQNEAKYMDARAKDANDRAMQFIAHAGYALQIWGTYDLWPTVFEHVDAASFYPLMKSVVEAGDRLRPAARCGQAVPAELDLARPTWGFPHADSHGDLEHAGDFVTYNVVVPASGRYDVKLSSAGSGAIALWIDGGSALSAAGPVEQGVSARGIFLQQGLHTLMVQSGGAEVLVRGLSVTATAR